MIKAKITKNIIRKTENSLGLTPKQIIIGLVGVLIGVGEYSLLKNVLTTSTVMTIVFITMGVIIMFGCLNIQGMNLFTFMIKCLKGPDIRYYESRGVFTNELMENKKNKE